MIKNSLKLSLGFAAVFAGFGAAQGAHAATKAGATVSLKLTEADATPTAVVVLPGSSFTITASLVTTTPLTGVDYYLQATGAAAGKFRITNRNIGSSLLSDPIKADVGDNGASPGVEDSIVSLLNPRNGLDLGASVSNVSVPLAAGTHALANYTISVPGNTPPGTYTLSTTSDAGSGWVATAPLFDEYDFNAHGSITVTVQASVGAGVPEPTGAR